jgi:hypothetical protein
VRHRHGILDRDVTDLEMDEFPLEANHP